MDEQRRIEPGDLIEVFHPGYQHWAVYIGNEEVVHLSHPNLGLSSSLALSSGSFKAVVMRQRIQEVTNGNYWRINNLLDKESKPRQQHIIVKEAIRRVGEELPYHLTDQNCEHFATELRYGKAESHQVRNIALGICTVAGAVATGVPFTAAVTVGATLTGLFFILRPLSR